MAMADHFLDTETRTGIPITALICVEAGLSVSQARDIWCYEVTPAVWPNLWAVAGEWAGWREDWLVGQIRRYRERWPNRPGMIPYLIYRLRVHMIHRDWVAIGKCMELLLQDTASRRGRLTTDLKLLANRYFDFMPEKEASPTGARARALRQLFTDAFLPIFESLVVTPAESNAVCALRVDRWLKGGRDG